MQRQLELQALPDLVGSGKLCAPTTRGAGSCSPENPYLCTAGPSHLGCASSPWAVGAGADCQSQCMHPGFVYAANQTGYSLDSGQEQVLRYIVAASASSRPRQRRRPVVGAAVHRADKRLQSG